MKQFKDKETGAIFTVNTSDVISQFERNSQYEEVKKTKPKTSKKTENLDNEEQQENE